jgi:predicted transposase YbfD/YdcC
MDLSTLDQVEPTGVGSLVIEEESLYREFEKVKDRRGTKGKRYPMAFVLTLILLGKMAGQKSISGIRDWIKAREKHLRKKLNWWKGFPVNSTYTDALACCDPEEVVEVIKSVISKARAKEECDTEPGRLVAYKEEGENLIHTAMDGKTMRGTLHHAKEHQPPVHLLALYEAESGIVIAQETVKSKENEITAAKRFLDPLYVKGRIISADAMHTQKEWCAGVNAYGGYYLLIVKENQPTMYEDLHDYFEDKDPDNSEWEYYKSVQKGHGRLEVREIWTSTQMNAWFQKDWAGIAQTFKISRWTKEGEEEREQVAYGFTNLTRKMACAEQLLSLNKKHWSIENRLHYRRDVTLGEDACQVRVEGAPPVLAAINGAILAFMDFLGVKNVASKMRHFDEHYGEVLSLIFGTLAR